MTPGQRPAGSGAAGPIAFVTSICRDLTRSAAAYQALLGYRRAEHAGCREPACVMLRPPHADIGAIHLVERSTAQPTRPWQVRGCAALEIVIRDADEVAARAGAVADVELVGGPRPAGRTRQLRVVHVRGPDGEILYLTRILPAPRRHVLPDRPESLVGRVYSVILAVPDLDQVRGELLAALGGTQISDRRTGLATVALVRGDPVGTDYRLSSLSLAGGCLVEIDEVLGIGRVPPGRFAGPGEVRLSGLAPGTPVPDLGFGTTPGREERE